MGGGRCTLPAQAGAGGLWSGSGTLSLLSKLRIWGGEWWSAGRGSAVTLGWGCGWCGLQGAGQQGPGPLPQDWLAGCPRVSGEGAQMALGASPTWGRPGESGSALERVSRGGDLPPCPSARRRLAGPQQQSSRARLAGATAPGRGCAEQAAWRGARGPRVRPRHPSSANIRAEKGRALVPALTSLPETQQSSP